MGEATQPPAGIGHNQPPQERGKKRKSKKTEEPFGLSAPWLKTATEEELKILARNHMRLKRKQQGMKDIEAENRLIMNRNIRRVRRKEGKDKPKKSADNTATK